ncbi:chemotaxis protein [Acinetobacter radioresistens]|uniref:chemotaxis protein n=1 Tax=Acinetobacter radioresistens TaxID=40216 RepID=UPI00254A8159|nr:chemotaxis protein [Acinetobacter radioresistens]MDK8754907.1 chemotaxis protein [Acinetobacter radioresistens]
MSYQTSIHFDPTALLIIKNEIDNSIKLVESAVSTLAEDQSLPFGIEDTLAQFQQCAHVLALIDIPHLAQIAAYSAELMRKIMSDPQHIDHDHVVALSEGTTMLKRYVEFICLREVKVPQFLLDTLNQLEKALDKPLTREGQPLVPLLDFMSPEFKLPAAPHLEQSSYVHQLYKMCLNRILKQQETELDLQGIKLVGAYLAFLANNQPSQQYWNLVYMAFNQIEELILNEPRLRTLIRIETSIDKFLTQPDSFSPSIEDLADILVLCISQEDTLSQHVREQLNIGDEILTDTQLQVLSRHLFGPDYETIHAITDLITTQMAQIRHDIEYNYQNMSPEKSQDIQQNLLMLANIFKLLNLNEAYIELTQQARALSQPNVLTDENYAQQLMNSILSAMNSIGILERHHTSSRLQIRVNNMSISLDRLDEAHEMLLTETKSLIDLASQSLTLYLQDPNTLNIEGVCNQFKEISGAVLFLGMEKCQQALLEGARFLEHSNKHALVIEAQHIEDLLNILASADMLIENLKNKQPVLASMFNVALASSQKLVAAA